ncbi:MAG: DUF429 domain-containing protein [bacterium]|nr:MAG: DUF429 domain-containing protein [bacterium]
MPIVAGVDSCPAGWLAVVVTFFEEVIQEEFHLLGRFQELFQLGVPVSYVAVDIPVGLLDQVTEGGRQCDRLARKLLGRPRSSSIFSPPARQALGCRSFDEARRHGLNRQSFGILDKVRELDDIMTGDLQTRIREAHPEVCFFAMAGLSSARSGKKKTEGRQERVALLQGHFFQVAEGLARFPASKAAPDDILDAYACAWTAMRLFRGEAACLPEEPPLDSRGLHMGIWY